MPLRSARIQPHRVVLFAVLGTSPAVLTETVWALASETPPVIPDEVVVLTTTAGRRSLESALFASADSAWERMRRSLVRQGLPLGGRLRFGLAQRHVRLFPSVSGQGDLGDIATSADNAAAADFMLRELRAWTEEPGTQVLASIAGGRKTMGALLLSCMGLLGHSRDRVLHVLVNPPFDTPLDPPFLFPEAGVRHKPRDGGGIVTAETAHIELIDVPFVRMRGWYEDRFRSAPPSYAELISAVQRGSPPPETPPKVTVDRANGLLLVEGAGPVRLSPPEFAAVCLQLDGLSNHGEMADLLLALKTCKLPERRPIWLDDFQASDRYFNVNGGLVGPVEAIEALRRTLSSARKKLRGHPLLIQFDDRLLPKREGASTYRNVKMAGPDPFADIRG